MSAIDARVESADRTVKKGVKKTSRATLVCAPAKFPRKEQLNVESVYHDLHESEPPHPERDEDVVYRLGEKMVSSHAPETMGRPRG